MSHRHWSVWHLRQTLAVLDKVARIFLRGREHDVRCLRSKLQCSVLCFYLKNIILSAAKKSYVKMNFPETQTMNLTFFSANKGSTTH